MVDMEVKEKFKFTHMDIKHPVYDAAMTGERRGYEVTWIGDEADGEEHGQLYSVYYSTFEVLDLLERGIWNEVDEPQTETSIIPPNFGNNDIGLMTHSFDMWEAVKKFCADTGSTVTVKQEGIQVNGPNNIVLRTSNDEGLIQIIAAIEALVPFKLA